MLADLVCLNDGVRLGAGGVRGNLESSAKYVTRVMRVVLHVGDAGVGSRLSYPVWGKLTVNGNCPSVRYVWIGSVVVEKGGLHARTWPNLVWSGEQAGHRGGGQMYILRPKILALIGVASNNTAGGLRRSESRIRIKQLDA